MLFYLKLILLFIVQTASRSEKNVNVGTVLFVANDNHRKCWTTERVSLLTSRMMFEDMLPLVSSIKFCNDQSVTDLIEYFRLTLDSVRKESSGINKHIMMQALSDVLGGYLRHIVLPKAKEAYYGGFISYESVEKLYQLYDELKCFLKTNGVGWVPPIKISSKNVKARLIPLSSCTQKTNPCQGLIYRQKSLNEGFGDKPPNCEITIPMPYFDSKTNPTSIAIPFRMYSLRNIESKSAAYVLMKFFVAANKCLLSKNASPKDIKRFNCNFNSFINKQVAPRLNDEKFYSAFGGVYRIAATLKSKGESSEFDNDHVVEIEEDTSEVEVGGSRCSSERTDQDTSEMLNATHTSQKDDVKKSNLVLMSLLIVLFIWFLLGSLFICYRIRASRDKSSGGYRGDHPSHYFRSRSAREAASKTSGRSFGKSSGIASSSDRKTTSSSQFSESGHHRGQQRPFFTSSSTASAAVDIDVGCGLRGTTSQRRLGKDRNAQTCSRSEPSSEKSGTSELASCNCSETSLSVSRLDDSSEKSKDRKMLRMSEAYTVMEHGTTGGGDSKISFPGQAYSEDNIYSQKEPQSSDTDVRLEDKNLRDKHEMFYPATYACHSSITGRYKIITSSEELLGSTQDKRPVVFGYDFETSSSESREASDTENYMGGGNISK